MHWTSQKGNGIKSKQTIIDNLPEATQKYPMETVKVSKQPTTFGNFTQKKN